VSDLSETPGLEQKGISISGLAQAAVDDPAVMRQLLDGISPAVKSANVRSNSSEALQLLSQTNPLALFPHWDYFVGLLGTGNGFAQYPAIHIMANLATADRECRFERAFDLFYDLLDSGGVMIAAHIAGVSSQISIAYPHLRARIVQRLLAAQMPNLEESRRDLVRGYVVEALETCMPGLADREPALAFIRRQQQSGSPSTRKKAAAFLKKWAKAA
jgi:hypothetical protein